MRMAMTGLAKAVSAVGAFYPRGVIKGPKMRLGCVVKLTSCR